MALSILARAVRHQLVAQQGAALLRPLGCSTFATEAAGGPPHIVLPTVERYEIEQANTFNLIGNVCAHPVLPFTTLLVARNRRRRLADGSFQEQPPEFFNVSERGVESEGRLSAQPAGDLPDEAKGGGRLAAELCVPGGEEHAKRNAEPGWSSVGSPCAPSCA